MCDTDMLSIIKVILLIFSVMFPLIVGGGLLIAEIVDVKNKKRAIKEGLFVYTYPF